MWERLRNKKTPPGERTELAGQLLSMATGHVHELSRDSTASRCLQAALKYGGAAAASAILAEAAPHILELSLSSHGNFLARRLIDAAPKSALPALLASLRGSVLKLARHPCGSAVLEEAYLAATPPLKASLAAEFYGPEFGLGLGDVLAGGAPTKGEKGDKTEGGKGKGSQAGPAASSPASDLRLVSILARATPARRVAILGYCQRNLTPVLEKGMVAHTLIHRVLAEFLAAAGPQAAAEVGEGVLGEPALLMLHTRDGAAAAAALIAAGSAKVRDYI